MARPTNAGPRASDAAPLRRAAGLPTHNDAGEGVAEDQWQPEPAGDGAAHESGHQDERYVPRDAHTRLYYAMHQWAKKPHSLRGPFPAPLSGALIPSSRLRTAAR